MPSNHNHNYKNTKIPSLLLKLTIGLIGMFAFLQVYSIQAILPVLMDEFSFSEVLAGIVVGATVFGVAIMSPFTGMISDVYGRKIIITISLVLLAIPTYLLAFVHDDHMIIVLRFIQGLSVPGITVVTLAYIGEEYDDKSQLAELTSFYVSGTVLGGFLGRFILGHLEEVTGWRVAIMVMGAITFCGAIWIALALPKSKNFVASVGMKSTVESLSLHLHNKHLMASCMLGACVLFSLVGCFTFINLHLADEPYRMSSASLANIFTIYLLGVAITPLTVKLINRIGAIKTIITAVILSACGLLLSLLSQITIIIFGLALMSTGVFITQSSTVSYIAFNVKQGRSLATGLYYMSYYAGGSLGAWVCGLAYSFGKWQAVVAILVIIQMVAIAITIHMAGGIKNLLSKRII